MPRKTLNDRMLKALKAAPKGERRDVMDALVPGFGVRLTDKGKRTFILVARYPGSRNPTRRALGEYGELTLEEARQKAKDWLALLTAGKDPAEQEKRARVAELQKRENTVAAVAADFIKEKLAHERRGAAAQREFERDLLPSLEALPVTEVTDLQIIAIIKAKKADAPVQARNTLALAKRFFGWAVDQRVYGLTRNPCDGLRAAKLVGRTSARTRTLSDDELIALWRASRPGRLGYPFGEAYRVLLLTGLRLNEVADATWREFDFRANIWTIPAARMKGRNGEARPHIVPLTDAIIAATERLSLRGTFAFSSNRGSNPVWMSDKVKKRLDARMLRTLRALALTRGENPADVDLEPWTNHDIRRTVRSRLSRLKISEEAREAVLAHVRPGIKNVYDLHDYLEEKREALTLWAEALMKIVEPLPALPSNVIGLMHSRA